MKGAALLFLLVVFQGATDACAPAQAGKKAVIRAYPFDLQQVRLLEWPFRDAMVRDQKYLRSIDLYRLLCDSGLEFAHAF